MNQTAKDAVEMLGNLKYRENWSSPDMGRIKIIAGLELLRGVAEGRDVIVEKPKPPEFSVKFYVMWDNHTFTRLDDTTLEGIVEQWKALFKQGQPALCEAIVFKDGKEENNRVGDMIFDIKNDESAQKWLAACKADERITSAMAAINRQRNDNGELVMLEKHKFRVNQRVRPSDYSIGRCIFPKTRQAQTGVVVSVDRFNCPTVLWEGRKTPLSYHPDFISPDRRRKTPSQ